MEEKVKILVCGDVRGNFNYFFDKVQSINKKSGPFEIVFCVGEFFGDKIEELIAYKNGYKAVPVPTYILGPNRKETQKYYENLENDEICTNLTYLGKRGLYTLSSGIRIAYLSGLECNDDDQNKTGLDLFHFTKDDVISVRNSCIVSKGTSSDYRGIDILLTSQWPYGIKENIQNTSKLISQLVKEIRPRYHFCGLNGIYYEPPPFRIGSDLTTQLELATRFLSLGYVQKNSKEKYVYGFSLTPVNKMRIIDLIQKTTNETNCPFNDVQQFQNINNQDTLSNTQYFYDLESKGDSSGKNNRKHKNNFENDTEQKRQKKIMDTETCWFCLSSPSVEKHLVIAIGKHFYLALPKGPIVDTHVLILPIKHIQKASLLCGEEWKELCQFKKSLQKFYAKQNEVVCFFERNYKTSHLQINAVPIDDGLEWKINHTFTDKCEEYDVKFETLSKLLQPNDLPERGPYFVAELPDNTVLLTKDMKNFPLHFARDVFCSENLLNCDEKVDWRDCNLSKEEEVQLVNEFREKYKKFDFTKM